MSYLYENYIYLNKLTNRMKITLIRAEIIEERGVLAEIIGVVEVVVGCEHIARNEDQAAAHLAAQGAAASDVDFFCKHSRIFL